MMVVLATEELGHGRSRYAFHVASKTRTLEQREVYRRQAAARPKHVWSIRSKLQSRGTNARPMFNLAIDSKLRACDVVALKVEDILWTPGAHAQTPRGLF